MTKVDNGEKKKSKNKMGAAPVPIDWKRVDRALMASTDNEKITGVIVADLIGVHPDTLYRAVKREFNMTFAAYSAKKRAKGDVLLLEKQMDIAMAGDKIMLIWLGKQRLGQSDKVEKNINQTVHTQVLEIPDNKTNPGSQSDLSKPWDDQSAT